jgi:hypothetical protein
MSRAGRFFRTGLGTQRLRTLIRRHAAGYITSQQPDKQRQCGRLEGRSHAEAGPEAAPAALAAGTGGDFHLLHGFAACFLGGSGRLQGGETFFRRGGGVLLGAGAGDGSLLGGSFQLGALFGGAGCFEISAAAFDGGLFGTTFGVAQGFGLACQGLLGVATDAGEGGGFGFFELAALEGFEALPTRVDTVPRYRLFGSVVLGSRDFAG